jgi:biotin carboxyl carrier protein
MPKEFYTEKDIEDMVKRGLLSLDVNENIVLTELAYEKANRLGMKLVRSQPDNPPAAPVRPYLSEKAAARPATPATSLPAPAYTAVQSDLTGRIRSAVLVKLGTQVDPALLDTIIQRVLKSTGLK